MELRVRMSKALLLLNSRNITSSSLVYNIAEFPADNAAKFVLKPCVWIIVNPLDIVTDAFLDSAMINYQIALTATYCCHLGRQNENDALLLLL